jgi:hypothetical protein
MVEVFTPQELENTTNQLTLSFVSPAELFVSILMGTADMQCLLCSQEHQQYHPFKWGWKMTPSSRNVNF